MKPVLFLFIFFSWSTAYANDGAYYVSGNQLIPMYESDIVVKKEILTIKRIGGNKAVITVYYEFFNPKKSKELEVGFEAYSAEGDADQKPVNGRHPYISSFTVNMNGASIPHKVTIVGDTAYYKNGKFKAKTVAQAIKEAEETDYVAFFYVYHFRAPFKEGINIIQHTYTVDLSISVATMYELHYVLTAAMRWGNRQIDDFTLQIDMGNFQDVCIPATFFSDVAEWQLSGEGKSIQVSAGGFKSADTAEFFVRKGMIIYQKKNFKPTGELTLCSNSFSWYLATAEITGEPFDSQRDPLPFAIESQESFTEAKNDLSKRILKNLPFARRGYVFKSAELQSYFEKQKWYAKDTNYKAGLASLTAEEQAWVNKW